MSSIQFSITQINEAVNTVKDFIFKFYKKEDIDLSIESVLYQVFDELKDDLWVAIEYPYVDKVYRDSFYTYFASKHNLYARDCIRVSFFASELNHSHFRNKEGEQYLRNNFRGYLIIRPTFSCPIGRSLIDKRAFEEDDFVICHYSGNVAVNGVKLQVNGFPHSSQDTESISCAETTIWSIMEYFGNRYADYRPTYVSHIIEILGKYAKQRLLPSNGLTVDQISFALKEFGFGTNIYARESAYENEIENVIAHYIESGIPIIAAIENDKVGHAIVIVGHEIDPVPDFFKVKTRELTYSDATINYVDYTDLPKKYIVNDDNLPPYRKVSLRDPVEHYSYESDFAGCQIESIVVPLYKKIYLEVTKAKELALAIISDDNFGFKFNNGFIFRFFLTSSRSFKEHISRLESLSTNQKDYIILSKMPKFIWCAEIYEQTNYQDNRADGLIIMDATEANQVWVDSLIFAGYPDRLLIKDNTEFVTLPESLNLYKRFKNNLD
jgi:hypothetical protein